MVGRECELGLMANAVDDHPMLPPEMNLPVCSRALKVEAVEEKWA